MRNPYTKGLFRMVIFTVLAIALMTDAKAAITILGSTVQNSKSGERIALACSDDTCRGFRLAYAQTPTSEFTVIGPEMNRVQDLTSQIDKSRERAQVCSVEDVMNGKAQSKGCAFTKTKVFQSLKPVIVLLTLAVSVFGGDGGISVIIGGIKNYVRGMKDSYVLQLISGAQGLIVGAANLVDALVLQKIAKRLTNPQAKGTVVTVKSKRFNRLFKPLIEKSPIEQVAIEHMQLS